MQVFRTWRFKLTQRVSSRFSRRKDRLITNMLLRLVELKVFYREIGQLTSCTSIERKTISPMISPTRGMTRIWVSTLLIPLTRWCYTGLAMIYLEIPKLVR
ncbi:hypothetical protein LINPERPRIM_LOCUS35265 [Linum perenne]